MVLLPTKDWPKGVVGGGGIGFLAGGFYEFGRDYHDFNLHRSIAERRFGSWHGWNRTISYGQRFDRTTD